MPTDLTIENLEKGDSKLIGKINSDGKNELKDFYENNKSTNRIFEVQQGEDIDCDKFNYYHDEYMGKFGRKFYVTKINSTFACKSTVNSVRYTDALDQRKIYKVERKNRPVTEGLKSKFTGFFNKPAAAPADAAPAPVDTNAAPVDANTNATGGRKSRKQRNQRKSRRTRNQRKSRRSRR